MGDVPRDPSETDVDRLSADVLDRHADHWFWHDDPDASMRWRREAYRRHVADACDDLAAHAAWRLFYDHFLVGEAAPAGGWLERCRHHAETAGDTARGWLAIADADWAAVAGDVGLRVERSSDAVDAGRRTGDPDLLAMALQSHGRALIADGQVVAGQRCLDEAMVSVVNDELGPLFTGWVYCNVVSTCFELADLRRAREWSAAAVRWCDHGEVGRMYPGLCRVYAVELDLLFGSWDAAADGLSRACADLHAYDPRYAASAHEVAGDLARRRGDLDRAADEYRRCRELGGAPQVGLALLRAASGDAVGGLSDLRAVGDGSAPPLPAAMLCVELIDLAVDVGDEHAVRRAAERLATIAADCPSELIVALDLAARGEVAVIDGDTAGGMRTLIASTAALADHRAHHEAAKRRLRVADLATQLGDPALALAEIESAIEVFDDLGAAPDLDRARARRRALVEAAGRVDADEWSGPLSSREIDVLGLVASGLTNRQTADRLVLSTHTIDRHMSNIRTKLGVSSRAAAIAIAYENGWLDGRATSGANG